LEKISGAGINTYREQRGLKIPPLVSEYLEWAPKSRKELIHRGSCRSLCTLRRQGDALYPLGKLVDHHQDVFVTIPPGWTSGHRKDNRESEV
jgi:hypothetical protein